jgi:acetylornithine deacetylase
MLRSRGLLEQLIAYPSVAGRPNGELAGMLEQRLRAAGAEVASSPGGERTNLWATIGPSDVPGLVLSAHMDVVSVDGQDWASDPFAHTERESRLAGRGTADMKGFLAAAVVAFEDAARAELRRPLHLSLSTDEEIGCVGIAQLAPWIAGLDPLPAGCVVGEPTGMRAVTAHKGKVAGRVTVTGTAVHSALAPLGVNAVEEAARLIVGLRERADSLIAGGAHDDRFQVPTATFTIGPIRGGTVLNVVPDTCIVEFEVRHLPGQDPAPLLEGIDYEPLAGYPGLDVPADAEIVRLARSAGADEGSTTVSFGTEAGVFAGLGIPAVVCGPGDIADAHRADESVELEQLERCEAFLGRLVDSLR